MIEIKSKEKDAKGLMQEILNCVLLNPRGELTHLAYGDLTHQGYEYKNGVVVKEDEFHLKGYFQPYKVEEDIVQFMFIVYPLKEINDRVYAYYHATLSRIIVENFRDRIESVTIKNDV